MCPSRTLDLISSLRALGDSYESLLLMMGEDGSRNLAISYEESSR